MAGTQHRKQKLGIRGMQESNNRQRDSADVGIRGCGMQEYNNRQRDSAGVGIRGCQEFIQKTEQQTAGDPQTIGIRGRQDERGSGMGSGYGHQEPTGFRGKNRGCGSQDTVTRNQRGSEGRTEGGGSQDTVTRNQRGSEGGTEGAVLRIRSPGTNWVPRGKA